MAFGTPSVKGQALRYLSQREHSRAELERKLARHVQDSADAPAGQLIARALDELAASNLQSEARVAESVLVAQGRRYGSLKLRQTLQAKGLAPELVSATLAQARTTEHERALEVWRRKFGQAPADAAERQRQQRFLAARGFDADLVRRIVRDADDAD
ncbi:MAG: recombination regulator RecX [Rubrivivax sp.]|nr:recombination regulator RecX [Rubrivivax sp.]